MALCAAGLLSGGVIEACSAESRSAPDDALVDAAHGDGGQKTDAPWISGDGAPPADGSADTGPGDAADDALVLPDTLRVNELFFERRNDAGAGAKDLYEWVEITGPVGTRLDQYRLQIRDASGAVKFDRPIGDANATMPQTERWVVGGALLPNAVIDKFFILPDGWGLDETGGSIALVLGLGATGQAIDRVAWGTGTDGGGEGAFATVPANTALALGRSPDKKDTDANMMDFCAIAPTPKTTNGACIP